MEESDATWSPGAASGRGAKRRKESRSKSSGTEPSAASFLSGTEPAGHAGPCFLKGMAAPAIGNGHQKADLGGTSHRHLVEERAASCIQGMRLALKKMRLPQFKGDVSCATALPRKRPVPFPVFFPLTPIRLQATARAYTCGGCAHAVCALSFQGAGRPTWTLHHCRSDARRRLARPGSPF
jgi:hypothetical protein